METKVALEKLKKRSTPRKLIDSSVNILKPGSGYYTCGGITSKIDGDVLYAVWAGLHEFYEPELSLKRLKNYLKTRKLPDPEGKDLVDTRRSCHKGLEGVIVVKGMSLSRGTWEDDTWYKVGLKNLTADESEKEQVKTLRNVIVSCGCDRQTWQGICRAPAYQRRSFGDFKSAEDNPGPFVDSPLHHHPIIALNHTVIRFGAYDMEIFGYTPHAVVIGKEFVKEILKYNVILPIFRINQAYRDLQDLLYKPIIDKVKNSMS